MKLIDDLKMVLEQFSLDDSKRKYTTHNLELFYRIQVSRILAKRYLVNFDMREDYWHVPEATVFVAYAASSFWNKFAPVNDLREYFLALAMQLAESKKNGRIPPNDLTLWWKPNRGYITSLMNRIASESLTYKFSQRAKNILEVQRDLKEYDSLASHFSSYAQYIAKKDICSEDLNILFSKRMCFLPYLHAKDLDDLVKRTHFFVAWYTFFTSTNSYKMGGAQTWGPILGNNPCQDFLEVAEKWFEGKTLAEAPIIGFGSSGDEKNDFSHHTPVQELFGFLTLRYRPYLNKKNINHYVASIGRNLTESELADTIGKEIREALSSDKDLRQKLASLWREMKPGLRSQIVPGLEQLENCGSKKLEYAFQDQDRLWHKTHREYLSTFDNLDLGYSETDEAVAMAHTLLDTFYYTQSVESGEAQLDSSSDGSGGNVWLLGTGDNGDMWKEFRTDQVMRIGLSQYSLGDLSRFESKDDLIEFMKKASGDNKNPRNDSTAAWEFANTVKIGDIVIAKRGMSTLLGIGYVTGDYTHDKSKADFAHSRSVKWIKHGQWTLKSEQQLPIKTLTRLYRDKSLGKELLSLFGDLNEIIETSDQELSLDFPSELPSELPSETPYDINEAMKELFLPREQLERMLRTIRAKKNVILQGPPGVGKTFLAKRLAYASMGVKDPSRIVMVQFHQSFSYEDFFQGIRPDDDGTFRRQDRAFYNLCKIASDDLGQDYFCIIDEINRGNVSKIFGELLMLIEADKRTSDYEVTLTYATEKDKRFFIPPNVHIIGTMNTADRSLAGIDLALRRRFRFFDIPPAFGSPQFRDHLAECGASSELVRRIESVIDGVNSLIARDTHLGRGFLIGHSYFCPPSGQTLDETWMRDVFDLEISDLLRELWTDDEKVEEAISILSKA